MTAVVPDPAMLQRRGGISMCFKEVGRTKPHIFARRFQTVRRSGGRAERDLSVADELTAQVLNQIASWPPRKEDPFATVSQGNNGPGQAQAIGKMPTS